MSKALLPELATCADVFVHKLDFTRELALLVRLNADTYRAAGFLDDRVLTPTTQGGWIPLQRMHEAARQVREPRALHFIFHTGHVGSTLVSRMLEAAGALPLREPLPLRSLADAADDLDRPESLVSAEDFGAVQASLLQLWRRGYADTRAVIVKATSSAGRIAPSLLHAEPSSRAIYLNVSLESYLTILLAGENSKLDLRGHGPSRIRRLQQHVNVPLRPLHDLSLGELAAMSWLAETINQREALALGDRVLKVDFEKFLDDVPLTVAHMLSHLGLPDDAGSLAAVANSPALTRYSKATEVAYSPATRAQLMSDSRRNNQAEIKRGMLWIENVTKSSPELDRL